MRFIGYYAQYHYNDGAEARRCISHDLMNDFLSTTNNGGTRVGISEVSRLLLHRRDTKLQEEMVVLMASTMLVRDLLESPLLTRGIREVSELIRCVTNRQQEASNSSSVDSLPIRSTMWIWIPELTSRENLYPVADIPIHYPGSFKAPNLSKSIFQYPPNVSRALGIETSVNEVIPNPPSSLLR